MHAPGGFSGSWSHQDFPTSCQLSEEHTRVDIWSWWGKKPTPTTSVASPFAPKYICHGWALATSSSETTRMPLDSPGWAMGCGGAGGWAGHRRDAGHVGQLFAFLRGAFALATAAQCTSPALRGKAAINPNMLGREKSISQWLCPHSVARLQQPPYQPRNQKKTAAASFLRKHHLMDIRALFCLFLLISTFPRICRRCDLPFNIWYTQIYTDSFSAFWNAPVSQFNSTVHEHLLSIRKNVD